MNTNTHTLTRHREIREWVSERYGKPAIRREADRYGSVRARLELIFSTPKARPAASGMPQLDDGVSPVSWTAWLAELDRRQLALKIADADGTEFELVPRKDMN